MDRVVGRYVILEQIAAGGMATVSLGRLVGDSGFARTVAIKQLHTQYASDPEFVNMFLDEARLVARIRHPNVVPTLDLVHDNNQLFVVMEYVHGESLAHAFRATRAPLPARIISAIMVNVLHGLHAAHEATTATGEPLAIVHRDVSPQNVLVGIDGIARVLDFGIAKAASRSQTTSEGQIKGKLAYMAPEQLTSSRVEGAAGIDRRVDVWASAVVLWELITGKRLFASDSAGATATLILFDEIPRPSTVVPVDAALETVIMKGLERLARDRYATALDMARAVEAARPPASSSEVAEWLTSVAGTRLADRSEVLRRVESSPELEVHLDVASSARRMETPSVRGHDVVADAHSEMSSPAVHVTALHGPGRGRNALLAASIALAALVVAVGFAALAGGRSTNGAALAGGRASPVALVAGENAIAPPAESVRSGGAYRGSATASPPTAAEPSASAPDHAAPPVSGVQPTMKRPSAPGHPPVHTSITPPSPPPPAPSVRPSSGEDPFDSRR